MQTKIVSLISTLLAVWPAAAWAQEKKLTVVVLEGDGAFNDIRRKLARNPVVEIHDDDGKPVAGAEVVFTLPEDGASGTFANGSRTFLTQTDALGRAATLGLKPNSFEGRYNIRVTASSAGRTGSVAISQSNTLAGGAVIAKSGGLSRTTKILIVVLAGGAAGGGIFAAAHHGGSSTPAPPSATLSAGAITVGGPR